MKFPSPMNRHPGSEKLLELLFQEAKKSASKGVSLKQGRLGFPLYSRLLSEALPSAK
jgi:hypothetical protein